MSITFNEGIRCLTEYPMRYTIDTVGLDRTDSFLQPFGPITSVSADGSYGRVDVKFTNANATGQILLGFHGSIIFDDAADWYNANPTLPMNVCVIPFYTQGGEVNYLVDTLGVLTHRQRYGVVYYDYAHKLVWATNPDDPSTFTTIRNYSSGSFDSTGYNREQAFDVFYMRDEAFAEGLSLDDFPLYDLAIGFWWTNKDGSPPLDLPMLSSMTTNNGASLITGPWIFSIRQIAGHGYGRPIWDNSSPEVGPPSEEGGYDPDRPGAFDNSSDDITIPSDPTLGVSSVGFVRVYNTGLNQLTALGLELFPPLQYTPPSAISDNQSVSEAIVDGFNQIVTFLANIPSFFDQFMANTLINYVIDCHMIPVSPGAGSSEAIHVGPKTLTTTAGRIYTDYVNKSCGSINVGEYYGNFADYYANAKLYLPFVGFVPTRPEWFTGSTLSVDYKFNVIDGSFCCYVRAGGKHVGNGGSTIVAQYAGNACVHLPITGPSYAAMASGLVGAGAGMIAGAATGNVAAVATSAIGAMTSHGDIASSNAYNGSAAFLSCRYPFLMIERPVSSWARNYQHEIGIPANVYATLSDVSGFCTMENVHVDGISGATETEKAEIKRLLAQGVIV